MTGPLSSVSRGRCGLEIEAEAVETCVRGEGEGSGLSAAPSLSAPPVLEVAEPEAGVGSEASVRSNMSAAESEVKTARVGAVEMLPV
jgi:hypothetical protein